MRFALALPLVLAACMQQTYSDPGPGPDPGGWGTGQGGTGGDSSFGCHHDADCGGSYVCARDGECLDASQVRTIHVVWTMNAQAASKETCSVAPNLDLTFFDAQQEEFGFSPVPCAEGKFTVDKLPTWYTSVGLSRTGDYGGGTSVALGSGDMATLDLEY